MSDIKTPHIDTSIDPGSISLDRGYDDEVIDSLVSIMETPIVEAGPDGRIKHLSEDEKLELDLKKLSAASELARIALLGEVARGAIRDRLTGGFVTKGLGSLLAESEYLEQSRDSDPLSRDEEASLLVNDFITTWGEEAARKYGRTKYAVDRKTGKITEKKLGDTEHEVPPERPAVKIPAVMPASEVERRLSRLGWTRQDGNGGHVRFVNAEGRAARFGINHSEIKRGSLKADLRHAGITPAEFMAD